MAMSALGKGLMGAAMGGLQGAHTAWQQEQQNIQTERLLAARRLEAQQLAEIQAKFANAKDERDHEQTLEVEGVRSSARAEADQGREEARDRRARESAEAADKRNRDRIEAANNRPRGSSTPPAKQLFESKKTGEQVWIGQDDEIPPDHFRVSARSKPPGPGTPSASAPPKSATPADPNEALLKQARDAIAKGANREAVIKRLSDAGLGALAGKL
jgi:hypothetical protein